MDREAISPDVCGTFTWAQSERSLHSIKIFRNQELEMGSFTLLVLE
jgi:hypothetical protein